jgi:hypothetical protein
MLVVPQIRQSLREVLKGPDLSAEEALEMRMLAPAVIRMQEHPDMAIELLTGIVVPPHQRTMLFQENLGSSTNLHIDSRGTSKSTTIDGLAAVHNGICYANRDGVLLHGGGFRGGQMLFNETQRWLEGGWDSQLQEAPFFAAAIKNPKIVTRQASYWEISFESHSKYTTLPTNDPDRILGMRAKALRIDEANITDPQLIEKTAVPFLNVKGDFRHGGAYAAANTLSFTTTIDFTFRPFQKYIRSALNAIELDFAAYKAMRKGDLVRYREHARAGLCRYTYTSFDYSDLLIRRTLTFQDGRRFQVQWPNADIPLTYLMSGIPFTERGPDGVMKKESEPVEVYSSYPVNLESVEGPLRDGAADEATWKAEQRNIADAAAGDVYPHHVVDAASCFGDRYILPFDRLSDEWKRVHADTQRDYTPPVLWRCTDPCVLGIDYAGGDRDFTAYTVIRIGPMADGVFNPMTHHGKTPWSNVIWCEQHHISSHDDVRAKLHGLLERYNIVYFLDKHETDTWTACRGVGLDMRGGGQGVRDSLVYINDQVVPDGSFRIYDPLDKDDRVQGFATDPGAKPMLDTIWPQDTLNEKLVEFTKGQLETNLLYLPKYLQPSERGSERALDPAYEASKLLTQQLRKLQQELTARARRFYMPGNKETVEGKKDLWSSFIYAGKQLRAHLIRLQLVSDRKPPMGGVISRIGSKRQPMRGFNGRAVGSKG